MKDLTAREVANLKTPGTHRASRNLYVQVEPATGGGVNRSWLFRYTRNGQARYMGLGALDLVTLAEAREKVLAGRKLLLESRDPLNERNAERVKLQLRCTSWTRNRSWTGCRCCNTSSLSSRRWQGSAAA